MSFTKSLQQDPINALCEIVKSHLGIADCVKCIVDQEDEVFIKDVAKLLGSLHIEHPVGQFVVETCQSFADSHGCGIKSFLGFMGQLYTHVKLLLQQGVQLEDVEMLVHSTIDECIGSLDQISFPVLCQLTQHDQTGLEGNICMSDVALPVDHVGIVQSNQKCALKHSEKTQKKVSRETCHCWGNRNAVSDVANAAVTSSRHLNARSHSQSYGNSLYNSFPCLQLPRDCSFLSHGCDEGMSLASRMMQNLLGNGKKFDLNLVHSIKVASTRRSFVVSGIVVETSPEQLGIISSKLESPVTALLINGDLTERFRHRGYKQMFENTSETLRVASFAQSKPSWPVLVLNILKTYGVEILLIKGIVDPSVKDMCAGNGIAVITSVPYRVLSVLHSSCRAELVTYILDTSVNNLCKELTLTSVQTDWMDSMHSTIKYFEIFCPVDIQTVVFSHPCQASREILEQEFWLCAHRLAQATEDGIVLPGEGWTERWCANYLLSCKTSLHQETKHTSEMSSVCKKLVREAVSQTFEAYAFIVHQNKMKVGDLSDDRKEKLYTFSASPQDHCRKQNDGSLESALERQRLLDNAGNLPAVMTDGRSPSADDTRNIGQAQQPNISAPQQRLVEHCAMSNIYPSPSSCNVVKSPCLPYDRGSECAGHEALVYFSITYAFFSIIVISFGFIICFVRSSVFPASAERSLESWRLLAIVLFFFYFDIVDFLLNCIRVNKEVRLRLIL